MDELTNFQFSPHEIQSDSVRITVLDDFFQFSPHEIQDASIPRAFAILPIFQFSPHEILKAYIGVSSADLFALYFLTLP